MSKGILPAHFKIQTNPLGDGKYIVKGEKYRFTVLSDRLIRCEFSLQGRFIDVATQVIWNRETEDCDFQFREEGKYLTIETPSLLLRYRKNCKFSSRTLSIKLKASGGKWHFGKSDWKNLKGTFRTLDMNPGWAPLGKGLISRSGWSVLDDSESAIFNKENLVEPKSYESRDIYFFGYGTEYRDAIKAYYRITGDTPLIPRFALGNWWSRYWAYSEEELKELISTFEEKKIPLSVCIIDMDWHLVDIDKKYGSGWTGYTWNRKLFPEPQRMLDYIHDIGLKTSLNLHPADGVRGHEEKYGEMADAMGIDCDSEDPVEFNITDPNFINAYFEHLHHPQEEKGVDFWWIDWQQGKKTRFSSIDPLWMLNHLHYLDLGRNGRKRPFTFSRYAGPGSHRYPIGFSGDTMAWWSSLRYQPYFTATASNMGYGWWSHDIGGHHFGREIPELYARWVQLGVFSPILRLHCTSNPFLKREPWRWDREIEEAATDALRLRQSLIPYIYSMAWRNHKEGEQLVEPLYYNYPRLDKAYRYRNQFYFGTELMIAPLTKPIDKKLGKAKQRIFIPPDIHYDFNTGEKIDGGSEGREITRFYSLHEYPVFARAGAIISRARYDRLSDTGNPEELHIDVFPGAGGSFILYEDDGETVDYRKGISSETVFSTDCTDDGSGFVMKINHQSEIADLIPGSRKLIINFRNFSHSCNVEVVGKYIGDSTIESEDKGITVNLAGVGQNCSIEIRITSPEGIEKKRDSFDQRVFALMESAAMRVERKKKLYRKVIGREDLSNREKYNRLKWTAPCKLKRELLTLYRENVYSL